MRDGHMEDKVIKIRAHHGMCLAFFEGKGYSDSFTEHMQQILNQMEKNPDLQIVAKGDIICSKCPNLKDGICNTPDLVQEYDRQVLLRCGLEENAEISWKEFSVLVAEKILTRGKRQEICGNCQWTEICREKECAYYDETGNKRSSVGRLRGDSIPDAGSSEYTQSGKA